MKSSTKELIESGLTRVCEHEPMSRHTSWRVGGPADVFGVAENVDALAAAIRTAEARHIPWTVLGGGSNVLISDDGIAGLVILNRIKSLRVHRSESQPQIEAGSGIFFARLATFTANQGFGGLEWGVAIPGTVGAGVVNNAGAHHGEVRRALVKTEAIDAEGNSALFEPQDLDFQYRQSRLKPTGGHPVTHSNLVITRAWFAVHPDREKRSRALIDELLAQRQATQPIAEASAGSTFKNPRGGSAGDYIDRAGLKGTRIGGAEFSTKHANFIVNVGGASSADIVRLIHLARLTVRQRFAVDLDPEIQVLGRWNTAQPLLDSDG